MRTTSPATNIGWGVLGTGWMARAFAADLLQEDGADAVAVASRDRVRGEAFRAEFGFVTAYGSYEELVADPRVDIVYIATPHAMHAEHCRLALRAGKAVLCEKPWTLHASTAEAIAHEARERGLFFMEAMWTRHFPAIHALGELLEEEHIGALRSLHADFSIAVPFDPRHRLFDPALGGGALLDLGIYPIALAQLAWGEVPDEVGALATFAPNGVDLSTAAVLRYREGGLASIRASLEVRSPQQAELIGTKGRIAIPDFFHPDTLHVEVAGEAARALHFPFRGRGWGLQVEEAMRCMRAGLTESPRMPIAESLATLRTLDRIRAEIGLRYPGDPPA